MAKKNDAPQTPEPVMHTGTDTPPGQRDLAIGAQIAAAAGQQQRAGEPALPDDGQAHIQEITDAISGQDL